MADVTFRDFAGAIMQNDLAAAARVLEELLGLDAQAATASAEHFQAQMANGPQFMMKAMGLRTAITSGTDEEIRALLGDCFGLQLGAADSAAASLRARYPRA